MSLVRLHQILISTFVAFALLFARLMWVRDDGSGSGRIVACVSAGIAVLGVVYLLKARHLSRSDDDAPRGDL